MMKETRILGVMINKVQQSADTVQNILSSYGCNIRTRLGLNDIEGEYAEETGLILLELIGDAEEHLKLENELLALEGVEVQKMIFRKK